MGLHFWRIVQERREKKTEDDAAPAKATVEKKLLPAEPSTNILYRGELYQRVDAA